MLFLTNDPLPQCLQHNSATGGLLGWDHARGCRRYLLKVKCLKFAAAVEPYPLIDGEADAIVAACRQLGLFYAGIDLVRNDAGLWFIEANAQPGVRDDLALFQG